MKKNICLVTGGFDPIHRGHIEYFKSARKLSDYLVVGVNSDDWLKRKKGIAFMPSIERAAIIENLRVVDEVIFFNDDDGSACDAITRCLKKYESVIFANGGDRGSENTPETKKFLKDSRVSFYYGVGGEHKINSSSWLIKDFTDSYIKSFIPKGLSDISTIHAPWGHHTSFIDEKGFKVKQLNVDPGGILSLQKHQHRSEHWVIVRGNALVELDGHKKEFTEGEYCFIPLKSIHRLSNNSNSELIVIEVQCGEILEESDITRLEDSYGRTSD